MTAYSTQKHFCVSVEKRGLAAMSGTEEKAAPLLSIRNVYKSFGLNEVLKGIDMDVMHGEVLALIGGNGAAALLWVKPIKIFSSTVILGNSRGSCGTM
mgnify:CR=1 FL=1